MTNYQIESISCGEDQPTAARKRINDFARILVPYALIAVVVFLANWNHVWGIDLLINDDIVRYSSALADKNINYLMRICDLHHLFRWLDIFPLVKNIVIWELCERSVILGRLFFMTVFYVPLSFVFYHFYKYYLRLPVFLAFGAAVLPNIMPSQTDVPAYLDGCYPCIGLLVVMLALMSAMKYQKTSRAVHFTAAIFLYFIATTLIEHAVFLAVPFIFILFILRKKTTPFFVLSIPVVFLATYRTALSVIQPRAYGTITDISWIERGSRLWNFLRHSDPLTLCWGELYWVHLALIIALILMSIVCVIHAAKKHGHGAKQVLQHVLHSDTIQVSLFALLWFAATASPFIFWAPHFHRYYIHIPSFGYILLALVSLNNVLRALKRPRILPYIIVLLIVASGVLRTINTYRDLKPINETSRIVRDGLPRKAYPPNSQIVVLGEFSYTIGKGLWPMSDGYVKQFFGRMDMTGIMPYEYHFYNPFNGSEGRDWGADKMTGLDLAEPIFVFRYDKTAQQFKQLSYGLQWIVKDGSESWKLYKFDKGTGKAAQLHQGRSVDDYKITLNDMTEEGVASSEVAWGDIRYYREKVSIPER